MAKFISLYSGSKGNASLIVSDRSNAVLLDCGVSFTKLRAAMAAAGVAEQAVRGVVITHEHRDHIAGLSTLLGKWNLPVYLNRRTAQKLPFVTENAVIGENEPFFIGDIEVCRFPVYHDAVACCGYTFTADGKKISALTDCGKIDSKILTTVADSDLLYIESNYDETMLRSGPYPPALQRRIAAPNGHLSNRECAETVTKLALLGLRKAVLGHISENNNTYLLAQGTTLKALGSLAKEFSLYVADETPMPLTAQV